MNEREWQEQCVDLATMLGWKHLHVRKSVKGSGSQKWVTTTNIKGWPDLFLWHPRDARFAAIECKVLPNRATPEQLDVLAQLKASGADVMVAFPEDFDEVQRMLTRRRIGG